MTICSSQGELDGGTESNLGNVRLVTFSQPVKWTTQLGKIFTTTYGYAMRIMF